MSSKPGYLKEEKQIGTVLQNIGHKGSEFFNHPSIKHAMGTVGNMVGSLAIPIPIVGGMIGKAAGETMANSLSYGTGLVGEIGGMVSGEKSIKDVVSYVPNRIVNDIKNSAQNNDVAKVIKGEMNWRDAALNKMEEMAMVDFLAPGKTHAWKDAQGNYHKEYVEGSKMVVGTWHKSTSASQPRPDPSSNNIRIGPNGEVIRNGF